MEAERYSSMVRRIEQQRHDSVWLTSFRLSTMPALRISSNTLKRAIIPIAGPFPENIGLWAQSCR